MLVKHASIKVLLKLILVLGNDVYVLNRSLPRLESNFCLTCSNSEIMNYEKSKIYNFHVLSVLLFANCTFIKPWGGVG